MKYDPHDNPGLMATLLYSAQWLVVILPNLIIMGSLAGRLHIADTIGQTIYLQKLFIILGISSLGQVLAGHRLPLVIGPSGILLVGLSASSSAGYAASYSAICMGGLCLSLLAASGRLGRLRQIFTPRIVAVTLILIAVSLSNFILRLIFSGEQNAFFSLLFTLVFVAVLLLGTVLLPGIWKSSVIVWGSCLACAVFFCVYGLPTVPLPGSGAVWGQFHAVMPEFVFEPGTVLAFLLCFMALLMNELGSIESIGHMLRAEHMPGRAVRGVGFIGIANMLSGACGVIGPVDYSMSSGVIAGTGCAARYPLAVAGLAVVALGCMPQLLGLLTHIPPLVMGGLFLYLMSTQLAAGLLTAIETRAVSSFRHCLIMALPLMTAVLITFAPPEAQQHFPVLLRPVLANGFVMGIATALLLEHLVLRDPSSEKGAP